MLRGSLFLHYGSILGFIATFLLCLHLKWSHPKMELVAAASRPAMVMVEEDRIVFPYFMWGSFYKL
jgi:hypothetical protein